MVFFMTTELTKDAVYLKTDLCPECGSGNYVHDHDIGETICGDCGLVIHEQIMDKGPEWRAFTPEEMAKRKRVGLPTTYSRHDKGLNTSIDNANRDSSGRSLSPRQKAQFQRLRKWDNRTKVRSNKERNLAQALPEITRITDKNGLPKSIEQAASVIYRKAFEKNLVRGKSINKVAAASVYMACRESELYQIGIADKISKSTHIPRREIFRIYNTLVKKGEKRLKDITPEDDNNEWKKMPNKDPVRYIPILREQLNFPSYIEESAIKMLQTAKEKRKNQGKMPESVACAAVYLASVYNTDYPSYKITEKDLADEMGITDVTIRNRKKELEKVLGLERI
jgi:transcription initiation factor TFIIB